MKTINLNFGWKYTPTFEDEMLKVGVSEKNFVEVNIPHANKETPFNSFDEEDYQFVSCYRKHIVIEASEKGKSLIL
ncbi:MAG: hypothetical protein RR348_05435, partial [Clostridia bacterium]